VLLSRRKLIRGAIASAAIAALGGAVAFVRSRGYDGPWQSVVLRHLARRVCATDRPDVVTPDEVDVAGFVESYMATMPAKLRRDFERFVRFVEQVAPIAAGFASRFTRLGPKDQDAVLSSLEAHSNELLRGGFDAVKAALFMGYYRDPRTWSVLGYDGPRVPQRAPG
jgi:hypothetical protein